MAKWTAVVLTCPNKNSSIVYQKELKLRQEKALLDKESLIICIEDPEKPIGSGGATLNALLVVAESLSAQKGLKFTDFELLKDCYILIMHMGRQYPFDIVGKAFTTLPFQDNQTNHLLTNFDLIYDCITHRVAGLTRCDSARSDPGVYVCSTDMLFFLASNEQISIRDNCICVLSTLTDEATAKKNGLFFLDESGTHVANIYYQPDDAVLQQIQEEAKGTLNLISGIVYLNFEVAKVLFNLSQYAPIEACTYIGIDSGASPLNLSIFFDILLACCTQVNREVYLNGSFKTNHNVAKNQQELRRQARLTLWNNMRRFRITNRTIKTGVKHVYMDNETFEHKQAVLHQLSGEFIALNATLRRLDSPQKLISTDLNQAQLEKLFSSEKESVCFINNLIEKSTVKFEANVSIMNCAIRNSCLEIGSNTCLNDLSLVDKTLTFPENLFVQNVVVYLECFQVECTLNVVFGINDNLNQILSASVDDKWLLMNEEWANFKSKYLIHEEDLWPAMNAKRRTLFNAKLFPLMNDSLNQAEMSELRNWFWINLKLNSPNSRTLVQKWQQSLRLSLEDLVCHAQMHRTFEHRRQIANLNLSKHLINSIVSNRSIQFHVLIRNMIKDGFADQLLSQFDNAALENSTDLCILPRLMAYMSNTLCEMAQSFSSVRSGPGLNVNWSSGFELIENGQIEQAIRELAKERKNWLGRDDLLIRASRHYESAMLAFIRQATSSFKSNSPEFNKIVLEKIAPKGEKQFEWVEVKSPARLDLSGGWSDTPPITYEFPGGSCVTNVAILVNGIKPIGCKGRVLTKQTKNFIRIVMQNSTADNDEPVSFEFTNLSDFSDYNKPRAVACLIKAVCIFTKLVELDSQDLSAQLESKLNGSMELRTWTGLPHGSGLGTSSILISCVLKVVWCLMGIGVSNETLAYSTLIVEQLMTTNGGWQDQVGAIWGGFKMTIAQNKLPLEIKINRLEISKETLESINQRLILIYTGITRLAKDLLLNVLRNWYLISPSIYNNVQELVQNAFRCAKALESGDLDAFGKCINNYRKQKLIMAPGSQPDSVENLLTLIEPYVEGVALAGAGGGGFLYALLKSSQAKTQIDQIVQSLNMEIYRAEISNDGIEFNYIY